MDTIWGLLCPMHKALRIRYHWTITASYLFYIPLLNVYHIQYVHIEFHNYQNKEINNNQRLATLRI